MPNWTRPQSGTHATDFYRENAGRAAANALSVGKGLKCVSGDHSGANELCSEVIVRLAGDHTRGSGGDHNLGLQAAKAIDNLTAGNGYHKKQADHTGANRCCEVLAAATS